MTAISSRQVIKLANEGRSLIPCGRDKRPLFKWKPYQTQQANSEQLRGWTRDPRTACWAQVTGEISNLFTLDFDGEEGERTLKLLHLKPHRRTGRGGYHVDIEWPGFPIKTFAQGSEKLRAAYPGVDVRGEGGYAVVLGESEHGPYTQLSDAPPYSPDVLPPDIWPLIRLDEDLDKDAKQNLAQRLLKSALAKAEHGRNEAGFWLVCQLRDCRFTQAECRIVGQRFADRVGPTDQQGSPEPYTLSNFEASLGQAFSRSPRDLPRSAGDARRFSDIGNAERMVEQHGQDIKISPGYGVRVWDGTRWAPARGEELKRRAMATVDKIPDEGGGDEALKHYKASQSRHRIDSMINLFKADATVEVPLDTFDAKANLFNCLNGTLDLETYTFREHRRDDFLTHLAPVTYDPKAKCPTIDAWLNDILPKEVVLVIYELCGLLLIDYWKHKTAFFFVGEGNTGKSTLQRLIEALLGPDLIWNVSFDKIVSSKFAIADLLGKRANICADISDAYVEDTSMFKKLTGGDTVEAERKHQNSFVFRNQARLIFSANKLPKARDKTTAFTDRMKIINFDKVVTEEKRKARPDFEQELHAELSGFLNRAIEGLKRLRVQGAFTRVAAIDKNRDEYRKQLLPALQFLEERVAVEPQGKVAKAALYLACKEWLPRMNLTAQEFNLQVKQFFGDKVRDVGQNGRPIRNNGAYIWRGITLLNQAEAAVHQL